jgi:hypothetical protein
MSDGKKDQAMAEPSKKPDTVADSK